MSGRTHSKDEEEEYKGKRPSSKHEQHTNCQKWGGGGGGGGEENTKMENEN